MWIDLDAPLALDAARVGAKAAGVARLRQAGLPVPPGWCLPVEADPGCGAEAEVFVFAADLTDEPAWRRPAALLRARLADSPPTDALTVAVGALCRQVDDGPLAVRSSAVGEGSEHPASLSGQLSTFLGVRGPQDLLPAIQACWLSRWSDTTIRYALGHGLGLHRLRIGVLVQAMVPARAAGAAHVRPGQVTIEATWGLGRGVAEAEVIPDVWRCADGDIRAHAVGHKPVAAEIDVRGGERWRRLPPAMATAACLDSGQVLLLEHLLHDVERLFGQAVEVEWALDQQGQPWLLQVRPLGAATSQPNPSWADADGWLDGLPASGGQGLGRARLVRTPGDLADLGPADVVVAGGLRPGALAGVISLAGLVLESGGTTSHAASLARERGIPAVLGARGASHLIPDGAEVLVDGDAGRVFFRRGQGPARAGSGPGRARRAADRLRPPAGRG